MRKTTPIMDGDEGHSIGYIWEDQLAITSVSRSTKPLN